MLLPKAIAPVRVISRKPADRDRREGWQAATAAPAPCIRAPAQSQNIRMRIKV